MLPDGAYYKTPEEEGCQVQFEGCLKKPSVRIFCITEQTSRLACPRCHAHWRDSVRKNPAFSVHCPHCVDHDYGQRQGRIKSTRKALLEGRAAKAIDSAMHAEGLLVDIREKVLQRLREEASWLEEVLRRSRRVWQKTRAKTRTSIGM